MLTLFQKSRCTLGLEKWKKMKPNDSNIPEVQILQTGTKVEHRELESVNILGNVATL